LKNQRKSVIKTQNKRRCGKINCSKKIQLNMVTHRAKKRSIKELKEVKEIRSSIASIRLSSDEEAKEYLRDSIGNQHI